jgi:hypothetical protein
VCSREDSRRISNQPLAKTQRRKLRDSSNQGGELRRGRDKCHGPARVQDNRSSSCVLNSGCCWVGRVEGHSNNPSLK